MAPAMIMYSFVRIFLVYCILALRVEMFTCAEQHDVHFLECKVVTYKNLTFYIMNSMKMPILCGGTLEALHFDERDIFANLSAEEG